MVRLSEVTPEPLRWLWPGYVPAGKLTVLDGDPGLGKSTLLCELAARISRGDPLPNGEPGSPRNVFLCSAEDDLLDTIRPRIDAAGGDPQRIISFLAVPDGTRINRPLALPADLLLLEALVLYTDAALVILDPGCLSSPGRAWQWQPEPPSYPHRVERDRRAHRLRHRCRPSPE